jgi:hypothetical protein
LAHDSVGDRAHARAIPCLPVEALQLIRQDYARHEQAIWQCDLEGIALHLVVDRRPYPGKMLLSLIGRTITGSSRPLR